MEKFYNDKSVAKNDFKGEKIPKELYELVMFTFYSKMTRNVIGKIPFLDIVNAADQEQYIFKYNGKLYPFSVFSDNKLQKVDKDILKRTKRITECNIRSLKLACSMDFINPRISIGNSIFKTFTSLIVFQENGRDKVIDYANNLIMNKDDYYEIFNYSELNTVDKMDLYNIYRIISELNDYGHIFEYLIFTKEIFDELSKNAMFAFLKEDYDRNGFNKRNYLLWNKSDCLFFQKEDVCHMKFDKLVREIDKFTENPMKECKHIRYDRKTQNYRLKARNFGDFTFDLLSNLIFDEDLQKTLLSDDRYGKCHENAIMIARSLLAEDRKSAYVVGGKFKENEIDYFFHSWVEIEDKNAVIDFNHNIVMNKDKYYKLYEIVAISKTPILEMEDIIGTIIFEAGLDMHPLELNYFGTEFMRDLKKNEKILKK